MAEIGMMTLVGFFLPAFGMARAAKSDLLVPNPHVLDRFFKKSCLRFI
jgi:hypothetical protein